MFDPGQDRDGDQPDPAQRDDATCQARAYGSAQAVPRHTFTPSLSVGFRHRPRSGPVTFPDGPGDQSVQPWLRRAAGPSWGMRALSCHISMDLSGALPVRTSMAPDGMGGGGPGHGSALSLGTSLSAIRAQVRSRRTGGPGG